jgi:hypothetical protein
MGAFDDDFELIYFTDCRLGKPIVSGDNLEVSVWNIGLMPDHTMNDSDRLVFLDRARLLFLGVKRSERNIRRYAGDPELGVFLPSYTVVDIDRDNMISEVKTYNLEGILEEPEAWVDWTIEARAVVLELPDENVQSGSSG